MDKAKSCLHFKCDALYISFNDILKKEFYARKRNVLNSRRYENRKSRRYESRKSRRLRDEIETGLDETETL